MAPIGPLAAAAVPVGIELGMVVPFTTMQAAVSRNMVEMCWKEMELL